MKNKTGDFLSFKLMETESVWQFLQRADQPVVLYGMGDGALKMMREFDRFKIKVHDIFASDEFVRGHSFCGYRVRRYSEICEKYRNFIIVLAFAAFRPELLVRINAMAKEHTVLAPDVPVAGEGLFDLKYLESHLSEIKEVYGLLADGLSRKTYLDVLNYKISGKIGYLQNCAYDRSRVYPEIIRPQSEEVFVDLGAYNGDTIEEFISAAPDYEAVIAFEPDRKNYQKLLKKAEALGVPTGYLYNMGVYSRAGFLSFSSRGGRHSALSQIKTTKIPVDSVDNILGGRKATILKMDVEGTESLAIEGAQNTIVKWKPKLMVGAYHRNEDLFALPLQIHAMRSDYRFYLRHHPYIPAWETNYYAI